MIVEWFLDVWYGFCEWVVSLFGDDPPPEWLDGLASFISDLLAGASGLGAWFPFTIFGVVGGTIVALWLTFWLLKGLRWLYGLTPFSGGS